MNIKILLFSIAAFMSLAGCAFSQMNPSYSFTYSVAISSDGTQSYFDISTSGTTSCPGPNGCPPGVYHSATITDSVGSYGGTWSNLDRVTPTQYLNTGQDVEVALPMIGTLKLDQYGRIECTQVGVIQSGPNLGEYTESAVTVSKTTSGTSNMSADCTSATTPPDWGGLITNPYGVYPTQTSNQYVRAEAVVISVGGGPPWEQAGGAAHKPQSGSPPFKCTKYPTQVTF